MAASGDESVAAGRDIGTAVTAPGAIGTQHVVEHHTHLAAVAPDGVQLAASVEAPRGLTNLPERPRLFVGRTRELGLLRAATEAGDGPLAHVVHGLGGVGKSTLAAHWASEHARHSPVWWMSGDSPATLDAGLCALATAVAPALAGYMQQGQLRDWALQWLTTHEDWLLVLDNVADPADVKPLLAAVPAGRFLITSRRSTGWHGVAERISLDTLEPDEAADLFGRIAPDAGEGIPAVCSELGCLPLAVEQAAAYCLETGTAADEYLALLAEYPADMYTAAVEGGDMQRTVARVWHVTLDRLADDPLAVTILLTVSWFAPDDIPRSLLDGLGTPPAVRGAIGRLSAHSMVTLHGTTTLSVHRLVQAVSRTPDPEDPHRRAEAVAAARDTAAKCLVRVLPDDDTEDPSNWPVWRTLLPHVEALAAHAAADTDTPDLVRVFSRVGKFAADQQLRGRATRLLSRGEEGTLRLLGPDHPLTLTARNRLIGLVPLPLEEALDHVARCARVFGERHPEALTARYELTASYLESGDLEGATRNAELAVEMRSQVLGAEHPETLRARFGGLMAAAGKGDLESLASVTKTLLDDCVRSLGERHQLTLDVRVLWAQLMSDVGRSLAVPAFAAARAGGEEGDDLRTILERLRDELGPERVREWAVASIPEATRRLEDCETALGREHGDTVAARLHLAQMHLGAEEFGTALLHARQSARDAERYLGPGSGMTLGARLTLLIVSLAAKDIATGTETIAWFRDTAARGDISGDIEKFQQSVDGMAEALAKALLQTPTDEGTE